MKSLGSYIKALREKEGWPQRKLAHELDMDVSVLSKIENEDKFPKKRVFDIIQTVSRLFGISTDELKRIYLSDEISSMLVEEDDFEYILTVSKEKIDHVRTNKKDLRKIKSNK